MKIIDAGHVYELDSLDGGERQTLAFVKREGDNFPFNKGAHPGTNVQEVLRALIDRTAYLLSQKPSAETEAALGCLRSALVHYEMRAAKNHRRFLRASSVQDLVNGIVCRTCHHVGCAGGCHPEKRKASPRRRRK